MKFLDEIGLLALWDKIFKSITTKVTKIQSDIPVAGGPLASAEVAAAFPGGVIKSDSDVQALLMSLFCKEIYPKASVANASISSAFAKPSVTIPNNNGTVEVGTQIQIPAFTGYNPQNTPTPRRYTGFDYGYSESTSGPVQSGNPPQVSVTDITLNTGDFTVKRTYTLFGKSSSPVTSNSNATSTSAQIAGETVTLEEGDNKVKFEISGPGHKGNVAQSPIYYIASNLGNLNASNKIDLQVATTVSAASATAASSEYKVTGVYKYFMGYKENAAISNLNSDAIRGLSAKTGNITKDGTTTITSTTPIKSDGFSIVIACPKKYQLKTVENDLGVSILENFTTKGETGIVKVNTGTIQTDYNVYIYPITNGAVVSMKNITIGV